jgi:hypothetical protein
LAGKNIEQLVEAGKRTRFKPGQVTNPRGRTPSKPITRELLRLLQQPAHGTETTNLHLFVNSLLKGAIAGDTGKQKLVLAYVEGLPTQMVDVTVRREAERLAEELGLDPAEVLKEAERLVVGG